MKLKLLTSVLVLLAAELCVFAADETGDLQGLKMKDVRLPVYQNDRLQLLIYGREAEKNGLLINVANPVMDVIRRDVSVDDVKFDKNVLAYPLNAKLTDILQFWLKKRYCEAVIFTESSEVNRDTKEAAGKETIMLRSPLIDLDGVGFRADFDKRLVNVHKDVRFVIRLASSDPRKFFEGKLPDKYEFLQGRGDRLSIDFDKGEIVLHGNILVEDSQGSLSCGKLTVLLNRKSEEGKAKNDSGRDEISSELASETGIKDIICEDNVVVTRKQENAATEVQKAEADKIVYSLERNLITMHRIKRDPVIYSGENSVSGRTITINRLTQNMTIENGCRVNFIDNKSGKNEKSVITSDKAALDLQKNSGVFDGNVKVDNPQMDLACRRMDIALDDNANDKAGGNKDAVKAVEQNIIGIDSFGGGKRGLKEIICSGAVDMARKSVAGAPAQTGKADRAVFDYATNTVTMLGNNPSLHYGQNLLTGQKMVIFLNEERIAIPEKSRVSLSDTEKLAAGPNTASNAVKPSPTAAPTEITADSSDFNYGGNVLTFKGNVKVRDSRASLDCDRADIFLSEKPGAAAPADSKAADPLLANASSAKKVDRVVCTGRVHAYDGKEKLNCDVMTMYFHPVAAGKTASGQGLFQSNGTELEKMTVAGNVRMENLPQSGGAKTAETESVKDSNFALVKNTKSPSVLTADNGEANFAKNMAEFHGNVKITGDPGTLTSDDLYFYADENVNIKPKTLAERIDEDPFAAAGDVPAKIALGSAKQLRRMIAEKNVVFDRKSADGKIQRAVGEKALYTVESKILEITGTPDKLPYIEEKNSARLRGRKILARPDRDEMDVLTDAEADIFDASKLNMPKQ